jgi:RHS repeat-associated protein
MRLALWLRLALGFLLASTVLAAHARVAENSPQEKFGFENTDCICVCALLAHTEPREVALFLGASVSGASNLRFPGQYADSETGQFYNYYRNYLAAQGRYTQNDPIGLAGGANRFAYVEGNPLALTDPTGLDPWSRENWTPARVWTDMAGQSTTFFDPMTRELLIIPTRNDVASTALPGAAGPYNGEFTYCEYQSSKEYGTAKWRTTDPRYRWIHGGGSRFKEKATLPEQGWAPTMGCTRAQNKDAETLCKKSEDWVKANPGQKIPYSRW